MYISLIHMEYLCKICNESDSSLQGLKYIGGPHITCSCKSSGILSYVSYPESGKDATDEVECEQCLKCHSINLVLDPTVKKIMVKLYSNITQYL